MNHIYPRPHDKQTVYLKDVVTGPNIEIGDYTIYNDFAHDPRDFEKNNVLYHYPVNGDKLVIGRFCSVACGAKFLFTSGNHSMRSLSNYTFPIFFDEWDLDAKNIRDAWDNRRYRHRQRCVDRLRSRHPFGRKDRRRRRHRRTCGGDKGCPALYRCRRSSRQNHPQTL